MMMALLLFKRVPVSLTVLTQEGWTPLHSACRWNHAECAETLISWGADINKATTGGQTPLHLAAVTPNSFPTLQVLLVQPKLKAMTKNCQDDTPLDIAKRNANNTDLFDLVLPCFCQTN